MASGLAVAEMEDAVRTARRDDRVKMTAAAIVLLLVGNLIGLVAVGDEAGGQSVVAAATAAYEEATSAKVAFTQEISGDGQSIEFGGEQLIDITNNRMSMTMDLPSDFGEIFAEMMGESARGSARKSA